MSDHAIQSYNGGNGMVGQSRRPCQSAWMAHWSGRSTNHPSLHSGPEIETHISVVAKQPFLIKPVKFHNFFDKANLADDFMGSTSKDSIVLAKLKGKMSSEVLGLSPDSGFHGQHGVKLQLLGSSTDSEENGSNGHVKTSLLCLKNESSADTDTLEMNTSHENRLSGTTSTPSNEVTLALAQQDTEQRLLDINQRLPQLPAIASSTDDRDTSSSRTQSLGVERLFSNPEQAEDSRSNACPDSLSGLDPSSRWIKRLKLSASNSDSFGHGTKNSNLPEATSHEKTNKFSTKSYEQSWIRRWCHNQAVSTQKSTEPDVICEPESFKETSDKFQKKLFPSIAAMAMMGKAVKRFRPCEFQKFGPSVVWNTDQF